MAALKKNFSTPDETITPAKTRVEIVEIGDNTVMRARFEPGWRWSEDIKPVAGTDSCQAHHVGVQLSGRMKAKMDDGTEIEVGPNDVVDIPPGHDAWVVGDEPVVMIDFTGGKTYAR